MASRSSYTDMEEEVKCPICLELLTDPVTLDCGHNFCRGCITCYCDKWEKLGVLECPVCKAEIQNRNFRSNWQLANLVKKMKEKRFRALNPGTDDPCPRHRQDLHFFCKDDEKLACHICKQSPKHRGDSVLNLEEAGDFCKAMANTKKVTVCQKHQEPLNLFCKDDKALICVVCDRSNKHKYHETLLLEEASQQYKDKFCGFLEILKMERERVVACKSDVVKESQDLLEKTTGEKQEMVAKFRQLHSLLEEQEKLLLGQMEEVEEMIARNREQELAKISEELSSLESRIREMEEKCQQPAGELLQDARSTLQRYEQTEVFEYPVDFLLALKWHVWDFSNLNLHLEAFMKQLKGTLDSGFHLQKATVTLDPDTAHPKLILSEDRKSMRRGEKAKRLSNNPERFDSCGAVLGKNRFTAGCHFWEVLVGSEDEWAVGVARKSVRRQGEVIFSPEEGIWGVGKGLEEYKAVMKGLQLSLSGELKRIRVCLNYDGGRVAFFDADRAALIYEFSGASFSGETLLPFFWVYKKGHLKLCS